MNQNPLFDSTGVEPCELLAAMPSVCTHVGDSVFCNPKILVRQMYLCFLKSR